MARPSARSFSQRNRPREQQPGRPSINPNPREDPDPIENPVRRGRGRGRGGRRPNRVQPYPANRRLVISPHISLLNVLKLLNFRPTDRFLG